MKTFDNLYTQLIDTVATSDPNSTTVQAISSGVHFIGKKIIEEAGEVWIAAEYQTDEQLSQEISQLLYWLQTMMVARGITLDDIYRYL